tara:strand:+ start:392 stop:1261 length:870 start_codon:yes stop_codon:yes gene_type:complete
MLNRARYFLEALLLGFLLLLFKILGPDFASSLGGFLGRVIGPRLAASRKALRNIQRAFPEKNETEKQEILIGMWEHLGRLFAEYPHLKFIAKNRVKLNDGLEFNQGNQEDINSIFFGAHFGNWELNAPAVYLQFNHAVDVSYRAPNNPWVDKMLMRMRSMDGNIPAHAKSRTGGRDMMLAIKAGRSLGILIDQKYNEGLSVPFFGEEAMTNPFFVQLAQKFKCPLVPIRNTRLDGANFSLTLYDEIKVFDSEGKPREVKDVIMEAHALLEEWIKEHPEQWLWLHKRWPN